MKHILVSSLRNFICNIKETVKTINLVPESKEVVHKCGNRRQEEEEICIIISLMLSKKISFFLEIAIQFIR